MKIYLLGGSSKTHGAMSEKSSDDSCKYLERLNVIVVTNTIVKDYDGKVVTMQNGETIESAMVIWAAGIKGNVPAGINKDLIVPVSYTHLRAHETRHDLVCRLLLEK